MTQVFLSSPTFVTLSLERGRVLSLVPGVSAVLAVAIPGESVAQPVVAPASFGPYEQRQEATLNLSLGTAVYEVLESAAGGSGELTADAIADTLEAAPPADLARIQASVSGDRVRAAAAGPLFDQSGQRVWINELAVNDKAFAVMASPPTITYTDTNPVTGQNWAVTNQASYAASPYFNIFRASHLYLRSTGYPLYFFQAAKTVTQVSPQPYGTLTMQVSFIHYGSRFSMFYYGSGTTFLFKVNNEYVSLTPTVRPTDGGLHYAVFDFGSVSRRRIDIIGGISDFYFGGVWTDAYDSITPASRRGPRTVVIGDSFGEGTGNEISSMFSWIDYLTEYLGWDDVIKSAVGGTGIVHAGGRVNWQTRALYDIAEAKPDVVWICMSVNDSGYPASQVLAGAQAIVDTVHGAGVYPTWIFSSPTQARGTGLQSYNVRQANHAVRIWCSTKGYVFVDDMEMPLDKNVTPQTTTLTSAAAAGAATVTTANRLITGCAYKFPDQTAFFVNNAPGLTATIDQVQTPWPIGTVVTQCGPSLLTGIGYVGNTTAWGSSNVCISSDSTHPTNRGHQLKGYADAQLLAAIVGRK